MGVVAIVVVVFFILSVLLGFWAGWYVQGGKIKELQNDIDNIFASVANYVDSVDMKNKTQAEVICSLLEKIVEGLNNEEQS